MVLGTINNQGNIQVGGSLVLNGDTVLQGGGTVTPGGTGAFLDGTHVLTNVNNTIQGAGQIGDSTFGFPTLVNGAAGTINANISGQTLGVKGIAVTNAGLMEATGGGTLDLQPGFGAITNVNNIGGTIAANGGTVGLGGGTIHRRNDHGVEWRYGVEL
jgi:hypothetical protein